MRFLQNKILESDNLFEYLTDCLRSTKFSELVLRVTKYPRRFFLFARILKWIRYAVRIIETSAMFILAAALLLTILPLGALIIAILLTADDIRASLILRRMDKPGRVYVLFSAGRYGESFAKTLDGEVYIVGGELIHRFLTYRREEGFTRISRAFFIKFRRRFLDSAPERVSYLF